MEGHGGRVIRVDFLRCGQRNACDNVRIHPVGVIRRLQFCFRDIPVAYDTDAQRRENIRVRYLAAGGSRPCRVA